MALAPINPTQLTPPRVEFIDPRSGAISREWYRFFLSLLTATQANQDETTLGPDTASLLATYDAMLASTAQASAVTSDGMVASLESSLNNLQNAFGITPPDLGGTVTSVAASGGLTGLTFTGSPITTSGTLTLGGTLGVGYGGTGQTSYTDGQLLIGNSTGNTLTKATLTAGTNVTITNGAGAITINATDAFVGTVTSVSVVSANGFAGTVATATTTPAITLSTSVTGLVKGNGTALSAAIAGTDYVAPGAITTSGLTMATARILGRTTASTGAVEEITVGTGLSLSAGTLSNSAPDQTVSLAGGAGISISGTYPSFTITNTAPDQIVSLTGAGTTVVTGTYPSFTITSNDQYVGTVTSVAALTLGTTGTDLSSTVANSTTTPVITLNVPTASAANRGALSSTDWSTFNGKQAALVSGTNIKTVGGVSLLGSGDVGTIGVAYGGTGATTLTSGYLLKGNGTSAVSASVIYDTGTNVGIGTASPGSKLDVSSSSFNIVASRSTTSFAAFQRLAPTGQQAYDFYTINGVEAGRITVDGANFMTFATGSSAAERMRIDSIGNVGIGTNAPNASAILDVQSTTKGFRLPNMTTVQKNAIGSPAAGLMVFDTTLSKACVYSGAAWQTITSI